MSGQKRLNKICKHRRVVAIPSHKKEIMLTDTIGQPITDKNGEPIIESVQLYNIYKMH